MAATVTTEPRPLSLSKNDNYLVATTDLMFFAPAVVRLNCSDTAAPADADTFVLSWAGTTLTFTWATSPDASGLQLPLRNGGESSTDYRARLEEAFRENEILVRNWQIINSATNSALRFRYRVSEALDLTATSDATGMAAVIEQTGSAVMQEENLRCVMQLYEVGDFFSDDAPLVTLEAAYATRSPYDAYFNLRELAPVGPYLPPASSLAATVPGVNDYTEYQASAAYAEMYYRLADKYGSTPVAEAMKKGSTFYVVYGGSAGDSRQVWGQSTRLGRRERPDRRPRDRRGIQRRHRGRTARARHRHPEPVSQYALLLPGWACPAGDQRSPQLQHQDCDRLPLPHH